MTTLLEKSALERLRERLARVSALRSEFTRLSDYMVRLRCGYPPNGDRAQAFRYLSRQIEAFGKKCDIQSKDSQQAGFDDGDDPWGGEQLLMLRHDLAELTRADAPYPVPLPEGCALLPQANFDPFAHGRLYNGMICRVSITDTQAADAFASRRERADC